MTERLAQLMHAEADHLDVPAPAPGAALSQGRSLRRRRRLVTGAAAVTVLAVIGGGALGVNAIGGDDGDGKTDPAAPFDSGAVFSIGTTVYLDDAGVEATIDDKAIKSLYYTSVGVLVRHGDNNWSDGGGPQRFSMVRSDGSVDALDITLEETVHSTDPTQPYMAYAVVEGGKAEVIVRDLRNDTEVARVPIPSSDPGGGWAAPSVSLSGDTVYVGTSPTPYAVNWRTGEVEETDAIDPGIPNVFGGRRISGERGESTVVDVATGEILLTAPTTSGGYFDLSPDGRYASLPIPGTGPRGGLASFDVFNVDTGAHLTFPGRTYDYGWTGTGDLFQVTKETLMTCSAETGECTTVDHGITMPPKTPEEEVCEEIRMIPQGEEEPVSAGTECYTVGGETWESTLRLGGQTYES